MAMDTTRQPKPHDDYYLGWIVKIAAATNVKLGEATLAVYLERLRKLTGEQMATAGERVIEEWGRASMMPPLAFILERCSAYTEMPQVKMLPPLRQLQENSHISQEEIDEWLQDGKDTQNEHIAKLEADPKWRKMAAQFGKKLSTTDDVVGFRNGPSDIPEESSDRAAWAKDQAEKKGWQ